MSKLERDGAVAVIISRGFGAGWSTWAGKKRDDKEVLIFDADIAAAVLNRDMASAVRIAHEKVGDFYDGGSDDLCIEWVPKGHQFEIEEYNGSESIHVIGERAYYTA